MHTIREKVKYILKKDAERIADFVEDMHELYPTEVEQMIDEFVEGCHIRTEKMYNEAVSYLVNPDGRRGAKWAVEDIERKSGIKFEDEDYTKLDYAYVVNMFYSDYGNTITNTDIILDMAKQYLEDEDYPGDPAERAYHSAKKRIRYFKTQKEENR